MTRFGSNPDSDPALQRLIVESRARGGHAWFDRERRELIIQIGLAMAFFVAAASIVPAIDGQPSLDGTLAAALVATYVIAARVEFKTGSGFTCPTQLVLVPMLFMLPVSLVPLFVAAGLVLSRFPELLRGDVGGTAAVVAVNDAWHAIGPALVLGLAGATTPEWADWPIYLAALAAQFAFDFASTFVRTKLALGVSARTLIEELAVIYAIDALLAPIGLLAAFASVSWQWAFLLVLPLIGLIRLFARERDARIANALTLSSAYRGTAHLLGELLATTHEYTGTHSRSVVVLAHQVGKALGLDERTLREIEFGALLHDVGKMSVPNEIINKPGKLTDEEWAVMKRHTLEGEEMLDRIGGVLAEVGAVVRSHHERYDGGGYPDGLAAEEIPIAARVITACDSFNAMTTDRPYRAAMSIAEAVRELRDCGGSQFDPVVVEAVIGVVGEWTDGDQRGEDDGSAAALESRPRAREEPGNPRGEARLPA